MSRLRPRTLVILAIAIVSAALQAPVASARSAQKPQAHLAALQGHRVERADLTLNSYPSQDGSVDVLANGGDLQFHKNIRADGSYTLTLQALRDTVVIAFEAHTISVARGRKTAVLSLGSASEDDFNKAHSLLADSKAVRLLRAAAANVQDSNDDSPESESFILADAVVGLLTGDASAPMRAARHLTRHRRANLRPAAMQVDCYTTWETRITTAYDEFTSCTYDFAVWNPMQYLCASRWLIQAESYWFAFITCSGFSQF